MKDQVIPVILLKESQSRSFLLFITQFAPQIIKRFNLKLNQSHEESMQLSKIRVREGERGGVDQSHFSAEYG